jgi:hypothetical protein
MLFSGCSDEVDFSVNQTSSYDLLHWQSEEPIKYSFRDAPEAWELFNGYLTETSGAVSQIQSFSLPHSNCIGTEVPIQKEYLKQTLICRALKDVVISGFTSNGQRMEYQVTKGVVYGMSVNTYLLYSPVLYKLKRKN